MNQGSLGSVPISTNPSERIKQLQSSTLVNIFSRQSFCAHMCLDNQCVEKKMHCMVATAAGYEFPNTYHDVIEDLGWLPLDSAHQTMYNKKNSS